MARGNPWTTRRARRSPILRPDLEVYTYAQLARAWGVTTRTVQTWLEQIGATRAYRVVRRKGRITRIAVVRGDVALAVCRRHFGALYDAPGPPFPDDPDPPVSRPIQPDRVKRKVRLKLRA